MEAWSYATTPPQIESGGWEKACRVKLVTMPKLPEPPFRAWKRSAFLVGDAVVIWPEGRTICLFLLFFVSGCLL